LVPPTGATDYITIRSSAPDSSLPPAGTRITPAYASLLPKIRSTQGNPAFRASRGSSYWRLLFLEIYPTTNLVANLVEFGNANSTQTTLADVPHHLVIDRCYLHGDPAFGQRRGVALNSAQTVIANSYFSDFKGISQDTQTMGGWNGPGPFTIENNYLEAAGENIMFGGNDPAIPNLIPSNIVIRRNLITKPLAWRTQSWTVKNLIELKNAQRVTIEGNVIENNWAAGQQGYAIVLTPRNADKTAPWTTVRDITIRNNIIRRIAGGFNILGYDYNAPTQQTERITIRNNLIYDLSTSYVAPGTVAPGIFVIAGGGPRDITIDHNTVDNNGSNTITLYGGTAPTGTRIYGLVLTNNLLRDNLYGIMGQGSSEGTATLNMYTGSPVVTRNAIGGASASLYPSGNDFPSMAQWIADFVNPAAGDYHLRSSSLSRGAATDGKDIGVDYAALNAAMGVPTAPTMPTPYGGTAPAVPGSIQVERYDNGGTGVAYRDSSAGNAGGAFRSDDVDIAATTDTGGGYLVGWTSAGDWLAYSVNVATAGTYTFEFRVASSGTGGTFHLEAGGVNKTGALTVPNTGGWQTWTTISKTGVSLAAGPQVFRLVMDSVGAGGAVGNFNWFRVTAGATGGSTPFSGTPIPLPGTIQAENFDQGGAGVAYLDSSAGNAGNVYRTTDVDLQASTDTGGGYHVAWVSAPEWLKYTVNVTTAGTYNLSVRVASLGQGGRFHIEVDGIDRTGPLTVPNTGGWHLWTTLTRSGVSLTAGAHAVRLVFDAKSTAGVVGNFNWIRVAP
jgi:hypothetical protein